MNKKEWNVPNHLAIIMDGNGRWANQRFMPRVAGHRKGAIRLKEITIEANRLGIKVLTVFAFSTENWSRPQAEVEYIMNLPEQFFDQFLPELIQNNCQTDFMGDLDGLPAHTRAYIEEAKEKTRHNTGLVLNFAINYGSQQEITLAVQQIAQDVLNKNLSTQDITPALISGALETAKFQPYENPDLIIRTSGELRLSNFLLWQAAYSEFYFTDVFWPDFTAKELQKAIADYSHRHRRYGSIKEE